MTSSAIDQAVALLRGRLDEARQEVVALETEMSQVSDALRRLGVGAPPDKQDADTIVDRADELLAQTDPARGPRKRSIAAQVRALVRAEEGPWTPALVAERLEEFRGERSKEQFARVIGAAFYNMRQRHELNTDDFQRSIHVTWARDTKTSVAAEVSVGEGSDSEDPSVKEGGTANGADLPIGGDVPS